MYGNIFKNIILFQGEDDTISGPDTLKRVKRSALNQALILAGDITKESSQEDLDKLFELRKQIPDDVLKTSDTKSIDNILIQNNYDLDKSLEEIKKEREEQRAEEDAQYIMDAQEEKASAEIQKEKLEATQSIEEASKALKELISESNSDITEPKDDQPEKTEKRTPAESLVILLNGGNFAAASAMLDAQNDQIDDSLISPGLGKAITSLLQDTEKFTPEAVSVIRKIMESKAWKELIDSDQSLQDGMNKAFGSAKTLDYENSNQSRMDALSEIVPKEQMQPFATASLPNTNSPRTDGISNTDNYGELRLGGREQTQGTVSTSMPAASDGQEIRGRSESAPVPPFGGIGDGNMEGFQNPDRLRAQSAPAVPNLSGSLPTDIQMTVGDNLTATDLPDVPTEFLDNKNKSAPETPMQPMPSWSRQGDDIIINPNAEKEKDLLNKTPEELETLAKKRDGNNTQETVEPLLMNEDKVTEKGKDKKTFGILSLQNQAMFYTISTIIMFAVFPPAAPLIAILALTSGIGMLVEKLMPILKPIVTLPLVLVTAVSETLLNVVKGFSNAITALVNIFRSSDNKLDYYSLNYNASKAVFKGIYSDSAAQEIEGKKFYTPLPTPEKPRETTQESTKNFEVNKDGIQISKPADPKTPLTTDVKGTVIKDGNPSVGQYSQSEIDANRVGKAAGYVSYDNNPRYEDAGQIAAAKKDTTESKYGTINLTPLSPGGAQGYTSAGMDSVQLGGYQGRAGNAEYNNQKPLSDSLSPSEAQGHTNAVNNAQKGYTTVEDYGSYEGITEPKGTSQPPAYHVPAIDTAASNGGLGGYQGGVGYSEGPHAGAHSDLQSDTHYGGIPVGSKDGPDAPSTSNQHAQPTNSTGMPSYSEKTDEFSRFQDAAAEVAAKMNPSPPTTTNQRPPKPISDVKALY